MVTSKKLLCLLTMSICLTTGLHAQSGWFQQNSGTTNNLRSVAFVNINTGYVLRSPFLRTTNGGLNWIAILPSVPFTMSYWIDENTAYGPIGTVYKTTDAGFNWTNLNQTLISNVSFENSNTGYAICNPEDFIEYTIIRLKKTVNGGANWNTLVEYNTHWPDYAYFYDIKAVTPNLVYCTIFGEEMLNFYHWSRVLKSGNGSTFTTIKESTDTLKFMRLIFPSADTGYVTTGPLTYQTMYGLYRVINNVWSLVFVSPTEIRAVTFPNNTTGYLITNASDIYKTTNAGVNWRYQNPGTTTTLYGLYFNNSTTGYAVGDGGVILKTTTGGEPPVLNSISGTVRYQDNNEPVTSGYVKAIRYDSAAYNIITVDSAQIQSNGTYVLQNCPPIILDIMAYENDEEDLNFVPTYYVSTIYWQYATHVRPDSNLSNINIAVKRTMNPAGGMYISGHVYSNELFDYTALKDAFIYARLAGSFKGHSISLLNGSYKIDSLPSGVYEIIVDRMGFYGSTYVVTLTNSNVENINFYLDNVLVAIKSEEANIPDKYWLYQNYPNPFNPVTKIEFSIPKLSFVTLTVYDLLGREILKLVNEQLQPGTYNAKWNAETYPSGVYFYKLTAGDYVEAKKMILIK